VHFLIAAALPSLDVELARRLAALCGGAAEPAVHELVELLAFDDHDQAVVMAQAEARGPLCRHRLLHTLAARGYQGETPVAQRRLSVPERVVAFLRGDCELRGEGLRHVAALVPPLRPESSPAIATLRGMLIAQERPIVVLGPALVGKLTAIAAAAAALRRRVLAVELEGLMATPDPTGVLADLLRERRLLGAVLVVRAGELAAIPAALERELLEAARAGELILTSRDGATLLRKLRAPKIVRLGLPPADAQLRLWRSQLQQHAGWSGLDLTSLVRRYPLGPGDICEAAQAACAAATVERRSVTAADLVAAARQRVQHALGEVAELVHTTLTWEDLVLRDEVIQRILEVVAAVRFREQVLGRWGFAAKMPYGRSVTALFAGPPGTGKTMVATLIAKELGLELYRIDLSKVVSKWIGETEKNLGKVFDHAQASGAVLLFDEADSLFAKRTEVKSSNDRYANLEVNYLLQRLEAYDGIALLTTNHLGAIDPAFLRRIRFRIELAEPDEREREALWRSMIPAGAPLGDDVDFGELARRFKVSGGHIKNAAVRAAFLAAGDDAPAISHELLARAAQLEWTELGHLPK
jgi:ATP-dependent 26S proteasome regulatory subunit